MNIFDKLRQEALFSRSELAKDDAGTAAGDQCDEAEVTFFIRWDELGWDEIRWDGKWDFIRDWLRWLFIAWAWFYELWNFLIFREMDEKNMHNLFLKVSYLIKFDNQKWYTHCIGIKSDLLTVSKVVYSEYVSDLWSVKYVHVIKLMPYPTEHGRVDRRDKESFTLPQPVSTKESSILFSFIWLGKHSHIYIDELQIYLTLGLWTAHIELN